MAGMMHDGYWYRYLAARRDISLYIALVLFGFVIISTLTGKTLVKSQEIVSRNEDPKTFWWCVGSCCVAGTVLLGLYAFTAF
jgi:hypothetical protein